MVDDDEIMSATEAVVGTYLVGLFNDTADAAQTETLSQTPLRHWATVSRKVPAFHKMRNISSENKMKTLRQYAQTFCVLSCVVDMVHKGLTCTERDVYYRNTLLFPNGQRDVHSSIERLCHWMDFTQLLDPPALVGDAEVAEKMGYRCYTREGLHIFASGKSILIGYICFDIPRCSSLLVSAQQRTQLEPETLLESRANLAKTTHDLQDTVVVDGTRHASGVLVNMAIGLHSRRFRGAGGCDGKLPSALVVVEKESTLRTILGAEGVDSLPAPWNRSAFLCSKGYPCRASRTLLHNIHRELPRLPIFVLVDGDPHGMRIALTFLGLFGGEGSAAAAAARRRRRRQKRPHRRKQDSFAASEKPSALLPVRWIGVRPSALPHRATGRAPLTASDRQVLVQLMERVAETLSFLGDNVENTGHSEEDVNITCDSLSDILREAEWMKTNSLKCALQAWPGGPMQLLSEVF